MVIITYFVHGTTTDNEKGIATGWNDGVLSPLGIEQSKDLRPMVADQKFDAIFCSDLTRAVDSADLAFGDKYKIIPDARLRECNYGDYNGDEEWFKNDLYKYIDSPFPNGESYQDVKQRIQTFLDFIKAEYDGKHIAIVAHQAPQLALEVLCNKKTWKEAFETDWRKIGKWQAGWEYSC